MVPTFSRSHEQRRLARGRVRLSARYSSPNLNLDGHVTDVSSEGLFFCSEFLDDQGELARVFIDVPARAQPIELRGEVRWVSDATHGGGMGIRLVDVSLEDRILLAKVVGAAVQGDPAADGRAATPEGHA